MLCKHPDTLVSIELCSTHADYDKIGRNHWVECLGCKQRSQRYSSRGAALSGPLSPATGGLWTSPPVAR